MPDMEQVIQQLQDAMSVTATTQERHARMLIDHEQWIADNTRALAQHREWLQQHEAAMHALDEKLNRLTDLILRGRGGHGDSER